MLGAPRAVSLGYVLAKATSGSGTSFGKERETGIKRRHLEKHNSVLVLDPRDRFAIGRTARDNSAVFRHRDPLVLISPEFVGQNAEINLVRINRGSGSHMRSIPSCLAAVTALSAFRPAHALRSPRYSD